MCLFLGKTKMGWKGTHYVEVRTCRYVWQCLCIYCTIIHSTSITFKCLCKRRAHFLKRDALKSQTMIWSWIVNSDDPGRFQASYSKCSSAHFCFTHFYCFWAWALITSAMGEKWTHKKLRTCFLFPMQVVFNHYKSLFCVSNIGLLVIFLFTPRSRCSDY